MKARFAPAALLAFSCGAFAMPTAVEYLPAKITLKQAVKLGDGSVLPAGAHDVQIHYKGFGNTAELWFFTGGVFKGKSPAEARGFPSAPPGAATDSTVKLQKVSPGLEKDAPEAKFQKVVEPVDQKGDKWEKEKWMPAGAPAEFNWKRVGFQQGMTGHAAPAGPGTVKLTFDSSNSAAGFSAILPYVEKSNPAGPPLDVKRP